jgi:methylmalonyl-CoA/ethylmalonyl-CoA epimerase
MTTSTPFNIAQVGVVVWDVRASMKKYHELFGWGPWYLYEYKQPWFHDSELHGRPVEFSMLGAEVQVGPVWFELIQPLEGPSIYREWLETRGEGMHHLMVGWGDYEFAIGTGEEARPPSDDEVVEIDRQAAMMREKFAALGVDVLMGGRVGTSTQFYYLDTEPILKVILESGAGHAADLTPIEVYP